jgi:hypothetical protein
MRLMGLPCLGLAVPVTKRHGKTPTAPLESLRTTGGAWLAGMRRRSPLSVASQHGSCLVYGASRAKMQMQSQPKSKSTHNQPPPLRVHWPCTRSLERALAHLGNEPKALRDMSDEIPLERLDIPALTEKVRV